MTSITVKLIIVGFFALIGFVTLSQKTSALSGSEFQAGRIIDDSVFFNPGGMSVETVQTFLNSKVPICDTNGEKMHSSGQTRAQYGSSKGYPAPYTCLRNYRQDTVTKAAESGLCSQYNGGNKSAAQIIYDVGMACGVNPKVLIVLLEKEQSLVNDDWPWSIQYRSATGYGCPDTAPCDAEYYGFFNQVYHAARQFKRYARDESSYRYRAYRDNYIQYNPNTACGGSNVYIRNQATAGLYNYTPYQPNASALSNLYGSGNSCSAYGNRNFWRLFNDWFGSTLTNCTFIPVSGKVYRLYNPNNGDFLYTDNATEICLAKSFYGYLIDGAVLNKASSGITYAAPVYRLSSSGGIHFYTANAQERNDLISTLKFADEGIAFYASSADQANFSPVYRLASKTGRHIYTTSPAERDYFITAYGFVSEGIGWYTPNDTQSNLSVYRLRAPNGKHFYTSDTYEMDILVRTRGYLYEGLAFTVRQAPDPGATPVYRTFSPFKHMITASLQERVNLIRSGYIDESISFYAPVVGTAGTQPVYRLYRKTDGNHIFTASTTERDVLRNDPAFIYEGYVFASY